MTLLQASIGEAGDHHWHDHRFRRDPTLDQPVVGLFPAQPSLRRIGKQLRSATRRAAPHAALHSPVP
jgi:hypothetical protein